MGKYGESYVVPDSTCPFCGKRHDRAGSFGGNTPKPGDLAFCNFCGALNALDDDLRLRILTEEERGNVESDPVLSEEVRYYRQRLTQIQATGTVSPPKNSSHP